MPSRSLMNRRTLLKGVGVALALPLLESMGWADEPKKAKPPVRLGFMYMPHGVILDQDGWECHRACCRYATLTLKPGGAAARSIAKSGAVAGLSRQSDIAVTAPWDHRT